MLLIAQKQTHCPLSQDVINMRLNYYQLSQKYIWKSTAHQWWISWEITILSKLWKNINNCFFRRHKYWEWWDKQSSWKTYASLCFQLSTDSFFYPVLRCLAPFLQNEKEAEKQFAFQRVCFAVSSKACLTGYASFFSFSITPGENGFRLLPTELIFIFSAYLTLPGKSNMSLLCILAIYCVISVSDIR